MNSNLLEVSGLHVSAGEKEILHGVDLTVGKDETHVLMGPNGTGKSTLGYAVTGNPAYSVTSGFIVFDGEDITHLPPHEIAARGIAHVPEGRGIFAENTVLENLRMGAYLSRSKARTQELLETSLDLFPRLRERLRQQAGTLSGGEQQMLTMARGLMMEPKLMLLDEPSMGLAPVIVEQIFEIIADLHRRGITILLVEQNARMALQIAQRGYVIQTGRIALTDASERLQNDPVVQGLISEKHENRRISDETRSSFHRRAVGRERERRGLYPARPGDWQRRLAARPGDPRRSGTRHHSGARGV